MAKLKVFKTSAGFHDAYVAATSRKAALEAWGSEKDLFAMGAAQLVTDPKLTAKPLASPGTVVKLTRGGLHEHLSASGPSPPARQAKTEKAAEPKVHSRKRKPKPPPPPPPRPSRHDLEAAEVELDRARSDAKEETAELDRQQAELRKQRDRLEADHLKAIGRLERQLDLAKARYDRALDRWRKA